MPSPTPQGSPALRIQLALPQIDAAIRGDTVIVITVTNGNDAFIY